MAPKFCTLEATETSSDLYCYAHEDDALREQLARHLSPLRRLRYITGTMIAGIRSGNIGKICISPSSILTNVTHNSINK
jgi:hypothetical protein